MRVDNHNPATPATATDAAPVDHKTAQAAPSMDPLGTANLHVIVDIQSGNRLVFKFVNPATGSVVQQIPAEQAVRFAQLLHAVLLQASAGVK